MAGLIGMNKRLLKAVDPMTFKSIGSDDYYYLANKQVATDLYSRIGLYNVLFVKRLYGLDKEYALKTIDSMLQKAELTFGNVEGKLFFSDSIYPFRVYGCVKNLVESFSGSIDIDDDLILRAIVFSGGNHGIFVRLSLFGGDVEIYGLSREDGNLYVVKEHSGEIGEETEGVIKWASEFDGEYKWFFPNVDDVSGLDETETFSETCSRLGLLDEEDLLDGIDEVVSYYDKILQEN